MVTSLHRDRTCAKSFCMRTRNRFPFESKSTGLASLKSNHNLRHGKVKGLIDATQGESDEDDDLCPVECVREFKTDAEFFKILEKSKETGSLVVVIDEYDEQSEVAERLKIKTVPLFHFYKNGALVEAFPTRDKERIDAAILKYTSTTSNDN
ncbi:Thioredoxin-like 4 [Citrus sinensis]|uniref:Thioredoxin-like 4 n=1 Tax=Citrus sinensis TaxID=2711 RepID=A0ACB8KV21_CITSI|nr:Thioredoxin-like 4 [Citrus sinensis]